MGYLRISRRFGWFHRRVAEGGNDICLVDWKRTKQLFQRLLLRTSPQILRYPLQDVPDAVLWHYRVQLNIHAWILRRYYEVVVTDLKIVCLHPDNGFSPLVVSVPLLEDTMERLTTWRREDLQSCLHVSRAPAMQDLRGQEVEGVRFRSHRGCRRNWMLNWML